MTSAALEERTSALLTLRPSTTAPRAVLMPNREMVLLLLHNCDFAIVMDHNAVCIMQDI